MLDRRAAAVLCIGLSLAVAALLLAGCEMPVVADVVHGVRGVLTGAGLRDPGEDWIRSCVSELRRLTKARVAQAADARVDAELMAAELMPAAYHLATVFRSAGVAMTPAVEAQTIFAVLQWSFRRTTLQSRYGVWLSAYFIGQLLASDVAGLAATQDG